MTNVERARRTIAEARARGVADFCVCAGSRNAPLLAVLSVTSGIRLWSFVDERSAAFFALGRAKLTGMPAAVVTTSGTAVAELLPAVVEAYYSGTPLVVITADRPARYRGTGAPQCIEQEGIFGPYASGGVVHVNVEFDEPLIDGEVAPGHPERSEGPGREGLRAARAPRSLATLGMTSARPVVIVGGLDLQHREQVKSFLLRLQAPVYAEPLSGLREDAALAPLLVTAGERMLPRGDFDGVVRIGNVPALRFWRDLDEKYRALDVVNISALPFPGLSRGEVRPMTALDDDVEPRPAPPSFFDGDRDKARRITAIFYGEPKSELAMFRALSQRLEPGARVYLGNSLPIREWDLAATREPRGFVVEANRGANGIDGQLSTFFGQCDTERANVCVVGDLTAIYDMNAPWIVPQLPRELRFEIVIVNNGGGRIFSRVASLATIDRTLIENSHAFHFQQWASMWGIEDRVTELLPDAEASRRAWAKVDALW
jgi:2-succinyl-5-enolpyruvyl-6-hydroxy-3-cyclohexene-1-carboxylate synthase